MATWIVIPARGRRPGAVPTLVTLASLESREAMLVLATTGLESMTAVAKSQYLIVALR
jgi:hypothetical protein